MKRIGFLLLAVSIAALLWVVLQSQEGPVVPELPAPESQLTPPPSQLSQLPPGTLRSEVPPARKQIANPVAGIVYAPDGRPLAAARVNLLQRRAPFPTREEETVDTILTAADGRFRFHSERAHGQLLEVTGPRIATTRAEVSLADPEIELRTTPGFRLQGIVELPDGSPLRGADVFVEPNVWATTPAVAVKTTPGGTFEFTSLEPDVVRVTVRHRDFQPATLSGVTIGASELLRIRVQGDALELKGRVTAAGAGSRPIAGAEVRLFPPSWNGALFVPFTTETGPDGRFHVKGLGPSNLRVEVRHPDYSTTSTLAVPRSDSADLSLELVPRSRVSIQLEGSQQLGDDATLCLLTNGGEVGIATHEKDGTWRFPGRYSAGMARLELHGGEFALGAGGERSLAVRIEEDGQTELPLELRPAPRVTGRVLGPDGEPLAGVKVRESKRLGGGPVARDTVLAVTDRDGRFTITMLPAGRVQLVLVHSSHAVQELDIVVPEPGMPLELADVKLQSPVEVHGRVVRGGQPLPGAVVFANRGQLIADYAVTDANGDFHLRKLGPGRYRLRARFSTARVETLDKPLEIEAGRPVAPLEICCEPVRQVSGRVVDLAGKPVPETLLLVLKEAGASARSGPDGRFVIEVPERSDGTTLRVIKFDPEVVLQQPVPREMTEDLVIVLPLGPRARSVSAKVLALPARTPITNAIVRLDPLDLPPEAKPAEVRQRTVLGRVVELTAGELRLVELPAGRALLSIEGRGLAPHRVEVDLRADEDHDLGTILLEQGAQLQGRVVGPDGRGVAGATIHIGRALDLALPGFAPALRSDAEGKFSIHGIGPHSRRVQVAAPGFAPGTQLVDIPADLLRSEPLPIVLQRGTRLRVRVQTPEQRGLALVTVVLRRQGAWLTSGVTAEDGLAEFDHLAPGSYELLLPQHREQMQQIELAAGAETQEVLVKVERAQ